MHTARKIALLDALGVAVYSRMRQVKVAREPISSHEFRTAPTQLEPHKSQAVRGHNDLGLQIPEQVSVAPLTSRVVVKLPIGNRVASTRSELVLPTAEVERFLESRMYRHFCLLFAQGDAIPVVENAVLSDTALHFEFPPKSPLKLGSMALLRSAWRAKRQAWLAVRLWRKQQLR